MAGQKQTINWKYEPIVRKECPHCGAKIVDVIFGPDCDSNEYECKAYVYINDISKHSGKYSVKNTIHFVIAKNCIHNVITSKHGIASVA